MRKHPALVVVFGLTIILAGLAAPVLPVFGAFSWEVQVVDEKADLPEISLAVDSHGQPHMVYAATPSGNSFSHPTPEYLMYASWDGSGWETQIVVENGYVGYSALAFGSKDTPHIVYNTNEYSGADNKTLHHFVNYATWTGARWSVMVIDGGVGSSVAVDSRGFPHIAYAQEDGVLKYASWAGSNWSIQVVDPGFLRPPMYDGAPSAYQFLTLDANDNPCIVYSNESTIKVATGNSTNWNIQTVYSGELLHLGNIAVDSYGYPHFTYVPTLTGELMYESWNGSAWSTQKVADKIYGMSGTFVKLDSRDVPHFTYIAMPLCTVYYAVWNGSGWDTQTVDQHSYISYCAPFALDFEGNPHICYLTGRGTGDTGQFFADGTATYATSNQPTPTPSPTVPELTPWNTLPVLILTAFVIAVLKKTTKKQTFCQDRGRILFTKRWNWHMRQSICCLILLAILSVGIVCVLPVCADASWDIHSVDTTATLAGQLSIAIDSKDNPHIAYTVTETGSSYTSSNRSIAIASWDGTDWNIQKIAKGAGVGYTSLVFDSNDTLYVTYSSGPIEENDTGISTYYLKAAIHTKSGWTIQTVDEGISGSIVLDSLGNPHIVYTGTNGLLKYASWSGRNWTSQTVDPDTKRAFSIKTVQYLALDSENHPQIIYTVNSTVKYATYDTSGWVIQTVLSNASTRIGNLVIDSSERPHFVYTYNGSMMYASLNGSAWTMQSVTPIYLDRDGTFVRLDANDYPHITYPSGSYNVSLASWNGTGWNAQQVTDSAFFLGDTMPLALDSKGRPHLCYMFVRTTGYSYLDSSIVYATSTGPVTTTPTPTPIPSPTIPEAAPWIVLPFLALTATVVLFSRKGWKTNHANSKTGTNLLNTLVVSYSLKIN